LSCVWRLRLRWCGPEMSADDRVFATALEARLRGLDRAKAKLRPRSGGSRTFKRGSASRLASPTRTAAASRRRKRSSSPVDDARPARGSIEAERPRSRRCWPIRIGCAMRASGCGSILREELLSLLMDVRAAFRPSLERSVELRGVRAPDWARSETGSRSSGTEYHIALSRGDHRAPRVPISEACNALYAAAAEWKQAHRAAGGRQARRRRAKPRAARDVEYFQRQVRELSSSTRRPSGASPTTPTMALTLVHSATRVARHGESASALSRNR